MIEGAPASSQDHRSRGCVVRRGIATLVESYPFDELLAFVSLWAPHLIVERHRGIDCYNLMNVTGGAIRQASDP